MLDFIVGKIKVYRENKAGTMRRALLELTFDPAEPDTVIHTLAQNPNDTVYLEVDIYKPTQRRLNMLERDNERLEGLTDDMRETMELMTHLIGR